MKKLWLLLALGWGALLTVLLLRVLGPLSLGSEAGARIPEEARRSTHDSLYQTPTPPPRRPRTVMPWEPHRAVLITIPLSHFEKEPPLLEVYREFLGATLDYTQVIGLFHRSNWKETASFMQTLESDPVVAKNLDRLALVPADAQSIWVRDYGPIFGRDPHGRLLVYDNSYRDPRTESSNYLRAMAQGGGAPDSTEMAKVFKELERLRGDDITPAIVASRLRVSEQIPTLLVRPPLALLGGDFVPVSPDEVLVSQSTLETNGGRSDLVEDALRRYYGFKKVHYLQHLPGNTIDHLDFIVAVLGDDVILVAGAPREPLPARVYQRHLHREIASILEANEAYLRNAFPRHRIIRVPLPPLALDSDEQILDRLRLALVQTVAARLEISPEAALGPSPDAAEAARIDDRIWQRMREDTQIKTLSSPEDLSSATQFYFGRSSADILELYVENLALYRSYLNSLQVVTPEGREAIFIPRYSPRGPEEGDHLAALEAQVLAAYREARPAAELIWIDCDYLVEDLGAVHCLSLTIPQ